MLILIIRYTGLQIFIYIIYATDQWMTTYFNISIASLVVVTFKKSFNSMLTFFSMEPMLTCWWSLYIEKIHPNLSTSSVTTSSEVSRWEVSTLTQKILFAIKKVSTLSEAKKIRSQHRAKLDVDTSVAPLIWELLTSKHMQVRQLALMKL